MWTEEKMGSLGVKMTQKRGSNDRQSISTKIWECPPPRLSPESGKAMCSINTNFPEINAPFITEINFEQHLS